LHTEYEKYKTGCETEEEVLLWKPNLNAGHLKQFMINWINVGMDAMTSDDFKASIRDAFMRDARHANMINGERLEEAKKKIELETMLELNPAQTPTHVPLSVDDSYCDAVDNYEDDDDDSVGDVACCAIDFDDEDIEDGVIIDD
jgi:hypothetical protein